MIDRKREQYCPPIFWRASSGYSGSTQINHLSFSGHRTTGTTELVFPVLLAPMLVGSALRFDLSKFLSQLFVPALRPPAGSFPPAPAIGAVLAPFFRRLAFVDCTVATPRSCSSKFSCTSRSFASSSLASLPGVRVPVPSAAALLFQLLADSLPVRRSSFWSTCCDRVRSALVDRYRR